jgi:hypothetical protein
LDQPTDIDNDWLQAFAPELHRRNLVDPVAKICLGSNRLSCRVAKNYYSEK